MADEQKNKSVWLNLQGWQVNAIKKKDGNETIIVKLNADRNTVNSLGGSLDGFTTIEVSPNDVKIKEQGRKSIRLDGAKMYREKYVKDWEKNALVDKNGDPVIDSKTGEQKDKPVYGYRSVSGAAIVEKQVQLREAYRKDHPKPETPVKEEAQEAVKEVDGFTEGADRPLNMDSEVSMGDIDSILDSEFENLDR